MVGGDNKDEKPEESGCLSLIALGAFGATIGGVMIGGIKAAQASR